MLLRAAFLASLCCLPFLTSCSTTRSDMQCRVRVDGPPPYKFENAQRLSDEIAWFYADVQDVFFGVDYYSFMEARFGEGPYDDVNALEVNSYR